jgi:hypothetical protein
MTHKLRHDLVDEINTLALELRILRRDATNAIGTAPLAPHLSKMEIATTRLWALVYAEPVKEIT